MLYNVSSTLLRKNRNTDFLICSIYMYLIPYGLYFGGFNFSSFFPPYIYSRNLSTHPAK